jgi:serine/threonine protein kinase
LVRILNSSPRNLAVTHALAMLAPARRRATGRAAELCGGTVSEVPLAPGELTAGSQIAGYQIEEQIGRGGMAVVYRAFDPRLGRSVALKILAPELARDTAFRERFTREMRAAAAVDHPHIVPVYDAGEANGVLFIAMRYVSGQDLRTLLDRERMLAPARVAHIVSQVASALDEAHSRGLVHRDVKPGNMLIGTVAGSGQPDHVYLSDFGLSKRSLSSTSLTATGQFLGTLDYMAPEQVEGRPIDGRADLYALACSAFEMLAGAPPFKRDEGVAVLWAQLSAPTPSLKAVRPDLPAAVDQVMAKALAKAPADRYQTCSAFAAALMQACGLVSAEAAQARPASSAGPPTERARVREQSPVPAWASDATDPRSAAPTSYPDPNAAAPTSYPDPNATAPTSYSADPPGGPHPSWPEAPPPDAARYVVAPPEPSRYPARATAPQRRRSWAGALLIVGCIVLLGVAGAVFAVLRDHGTSTPTSSSSPATRTSVSQTVTTTPPVRPAPPGPATTVREYIAAINAHRYRRAWDLGGNNLHQSFATFKQGYSGTAHDDLRILSVSGSVVTARLIATQADGIVKIFQGTYTVTGGVITHFDITRTS